MFGSLVEMLSSTNRVDMNSKSNVGSGMLLCVDDLRKDDELRKIFLQLRYLRSGAVSMDDFGETLPCEVDYSLTTSFSCGDSLGRKPAKRRKKRVGKKNALSSEDVVVSLEDIKSVLSGSVWCGRQPAWCGFVKSGCPTDSVPKGFLCKGSKSTSKATHCACRFFMFKDVEFCRVLVVLDQIRLVRSALEKKVDSLKAREIFLAVFGVTNISTYGGSNGTRGLFFYFHACKELGSLCSNAMNVVLTPKLWGSFSGCFVSDELRKGVAKLCVGKKWQVNKQTFESYARLDMLMGYSVYVRAAATISKVPSLTRLVKCVGSSGLHQQPSAPSEVSGRKCYASKDIKSFLDLYDDSLGIKRGHQVKPYFYVCGTVKNSGVLFETYDKQASPTCIELGGSHDMNVLGLCLPVDIMETVNLLSRCFLLRYGPCGYRVCGGKQGLKETVGCRGLVSWWSGDLQSSSVTSFGGIGVDELVRWLASSMVKGNLDEKCIDYSVGFKMNHLLEDDVRVQLPHLLMNCELLNAAAERSIVLGRAIISLDKGGVLIRIWPEGDCSSHGRDSTDKLVYVPPGTALILPLTVATSDCIRFSCCGSSRLDIVICLRKTGTDLPPALVLNNDLHYLDRRSCKGTKGTSHSVSLFREEDKDYVCDELQRFVGLFSF